MKSIIVLILALWAVNLSTGASFATDFPKCNYSRYSWKFEDDKVVVDIKTDGKCHHSFYAGSQWMLQDLQLLKKPNHGTVEIVSVAELNYYPDEKYDGKDVYVIKTCGNKGGTSPVGCSTIMYKVEIEHNNF